MWIKVNGKPLDITKITTISPVIELNTLSTNGENYHLSRLLPFLDKEHLDNAFERSIENLKKVSPERAEELLDSDIDTSLMILTVIKEGDPDHKVYGYGFYIEYSVPKHINHDQVDQIYSKLYPSKEEAEEALQNLLTRINKTIWDLPPVII